MINLNNQFPVVPIFHGLPKMHKSVFPPPLRPIISGTGSLCEGLSERGDAHLQPLVHSRPGYLRDSKQFLQAMNSVEWNESCVWVTLDVVSLYSCIPHYMALQAVEYIISKYSNFSQDTSAFITMAIHNLIRYPTIIFPLAIHF